MVRAAARLLLPLLVAIVVLGCTTTTDDAAEDDTTTTTSVEGFCVGFPTRDASSLLEAPASPTLQANDEVTKQFLSMSANGMVESAPAAITSEVETYVAALRGWQPGTVLMDDPATRDAVAAMSSWLVANCGPPVATTPPGTAS